MSNEHEYKPLADWNPKEGERYVSKTGTYFMVNGDNSTQVSKWSHGGPAGNVLHGYGAWREVRPLDRDTQDAEATMYENERAYMYLSDDELERVDFARGEGRLAVMDRLGKFKPVEDSRVLMSNSFVRIIPKPTPRSLTIEEAQDMLSEKLGEPVVIGEDQ